MSNFASVNDISELKFTLKNINWDFFPTGSTYSTQISPFNCRKYHWLPATFIAEIPFTLVEVLSLPKAVVYDPFGGIGTTFFQAFLLNRIPITTEICKVSVNFIKSLFILFDPQTDFQKLKTAIKTIVTNYEKEKDYTQNISSNSQFFNLTPWYSSQTLNQLGYLFMEKNHSTDIFIESLISISVSSLLKSVSSQDRGYGCVADNVFPKKEQIKNKDAILLFKNNANNLIKNIESQHNLIGSSFSNHYYKIKELNSIIHQDIRKKSSIPSDSIDIVITSPPYPNMVDYIKSQRLSYYFFNYDINEDLPLEIGARFKRGKRDALQNYLTDMNIANENITNKLKNGGNICYIMPAFDTDNKNNFDRKNIVKKVLDNLDNFGLKKELTLERIIPSRHRLHNVKWATLEKENILIYRKGG